MAGILWPSQGTFTGRQLREARSASWPMMTSERPLGSMSGVRPGTPSTTITVSGSTWTCAPFAGVVDAEAAPEAGPYEFAFGAAETGSVTPADANNDRIDIFYLQVDDPAESDGSTAPAVTVNYLAGTPAQTPQQPDMPTTRGFVLAHMNVTQGGADDPVVVWDAPFVVASGGVLPVPTKAKLDTIDGYPGMHATVTSDSTASNNGDYVWSDGAWHGSRQFASGFVVVTPSTGSGPYQATENVQFPAGRFTDPPQVVAMSSSGSAASQQCSASDVTADGFTLVFTRANTTTTGVMWIAVNERS